jgi:hypothetical protein
VVCDLGIPLRREAKTNKSQSFPQGKENKRRRKEEERKRKEKRQDENDKLHELRQAVIGDHDTACLILP